MIVMDMKRGMGKTTRAIETAYYTNSIILVNNSVQKRHIEEKAKFHLAKILRKPPANPITVITVEDLLNNKMRGHVFSENNVIIDELEPFLNELISRQLGFRVNTVMATTTSLD